MLLVTYRSEFSPLMCKMQAQAIEGQLPMLWCARLLCWHFSFLTQFPSPSRLCQLTNDILRQGLMGPVGFIYTCCLPQLSINLRVPMSPLGRRMISILLIPTCDTKYIACTVAPIKVQRELQSVPGSGFIDFLPTLPSHLARSKYTPIISST